MQILLQTSSHAILTIMKYITKIKLSLNEFRSTNNKLIINYVEKWTVTPTKINQHINAPATTASNEPYHGNRNALRNW